MKRSSSGIAECRDSNIVPRTRSLVFSFSAAWHCSVWVVLIPGGLSPWGLCSHSTHLTYPAERELIFLLVSSKEIKLVFIGYKWVVCTFLNQLKRWGRWNILVVQGRVIYVVLEAGVGLFTPNHITVTGDDVPEESLGTAPRTRATVCWEGT